MSNNQGAFSPRDWLEPSGLFDLVRTPSVEQLQPFLNCLSENASGLDSLTRALVRAAALEHLKGIGVTGPCQVS